jgi:hypothetical protein
MELVTSVLGYVAAINYAVLIIWFIAFLSARSFIYSLHSRWFKISESDFDTLHYGLIGAYKLAILLFFLSPYLVLKLSL